MKLLCILPAFLVLAACSGSPPVTYVNRDIEKVLVLIPMNETGDLEAPLKMMKYVEEAIAERGWKVVPHDDVVAFYVKNKFTADPGEITAYSNAELAKEFKVDVVLWTNITWWGGKYSPKLTNVYNSPLGVAVEACLRGPYDAEVWTGKGECEKSSTVWFLGSLGVLVDAVKSSVVNPEDYAPGASRECFWTLPWAGWDPAVKPPAPK